ncbi:Serine/threonine-protein kinase minibrain [Taenia solium]|eukprot:TsM_000876800 transcript=TsM_000876800 gene=TsM_000876800
MATATAAPKSFQQQQQQHAVTNTFATSSDVAAAAQSPRTTDKSSSSNRVLPYQVANAIHKIGTVWLDGYEIIDFKDNGTFGRAFRALDHKTHEKVARKVIKSWRHLLVHAEMEIKLLCDIAHFWENELKAAEPLRVAFPLPSLSSSPTNSALPWSSSPDVRVMHCDLKPETTLLVTPKRFGLKVIDLYRAPEVIPNLDFDPSVDTFSLDCVLVEMHIGTPLFSGSDEL